MPGNDGYETIQDFVKKMDAGELDFDVTSELKKLSDDQLEKLARFLMDREPGKSP